MNLAGNAGHGRRFAPGEGGVYTSGEFSTN